MTSSALIQTRIDPALKDKATLVLARMGLTVSDAVRMLLTRVANEGTLPAGLAVDPETYDAWFRRKVQEAIDDPRPSIPHEEVEAEFARRRAETRRKLAEGKA
ncbi:type II toxin-antitoxin system RelB/DinJ family antitoxin [Inquilinus sp. Marseille-Q2685]|uniref:type II toxin-antitoxin system RelB family antitoxin n=1 Tax=Inquilinus sp. Marseille-Q2685 TaxID=2866581 RepID=UPI001CE433E6|nr:type II toxin-antitoxin system RelB/DinJ family antitoxin [Inquilinus sp. Marseille-Q2685]